MNDKQRKKFLRIIAATILMISLEFFKVEGATKFFCYMIPYFIVGYDILFKAAKSLRKLNALDENFLMAFASVGAIALSFFGEENFTEAVAVILFYQVGELFESYAVGKSRKNISELMDIRPDYANIENFGKIFFFNIRIRPFGNCTVFFIGKFRNKFTCIVFFHCLIKLGSRLY